MLFFIWWINVWIVIIDRILRLRSVQWSIKEFNWVLLFFFLKKKWNHAQAKRLKRLVYD